MTLEFMLGGTTILLLKYALLGVFGYLLGSIAHVILRKHRAGELDNLTGFEIASEIFPACRWYLIGILGMMLILVPILFSGSLTPKRAIAPIPPNHATVEYNRSKDVIIETPPPRVEMMDGFKSLTPPPSDSPTN